MRVFMTGATGYVGGAVTRALLAAGHKVTGLARSAEAAARLLEAGVEPLDGTLADARALADAARDADGVVHTAATRGPATPALDSAAVHALLLGLSGRNAPFAYTSGAFVYGETGTTPVAEDHPLSPDSLMTWRHAVEREVLDAAAQGVRSVVIRVPMVYGRGGSLIPLRLLQSARADGIGHYVGSGANLWSAVYVDDLADLYVRALERAPSGSVFNAATGGPVRHDALAAAVSRAAGGTGETASWTVQQAAEFFGPYARGFTENQVLSTAAAERILGWRASGPSLTRDIEHGSYRRAP